MQVASGTYVEKVLNKKISYTWNLIGIQGRAVHVTHKYYVSLTSSECQKKSWTHLIISHIAF